MVLGLLSLESRPYSTTHDPIPVGPLALGRMHFKAQAEPKYHDESILS